MADGVNNKKMVQGTEPELIPFTLADSRGVGQYVHGQIRIDPHGGGVALRFDGYGTHDVEEDVGFLIFIERYDGRLRLLVFNDINCVEPQIIDMETALASLYQGES